MKAMVVLFVPVIGRELSPCISHIVLSFEEGAEMGGDLDGMELEHDFNVCREHGHGSLESSLEPWTILFRVGYPVAYGARPTSFPVLFLL